MPVPSSKILDHHGLVGGFCYDLGFADIIDNALYRAAPLQLISISPRSGFQFLSLSSQNSFQLV